VTRRRDLKVHRQVRQTKAKRAKKKVAAPREATKKITNETDAASTGNGADLSKLALPTNYIAAHAKPRVQTLVKVDRPDKLHFYRAHPEWRLTARLLKHDRRWYYFSAQLALPEMIDKDVVPYLLVPLIDRTNTVSVWPIRLPRDENEQMLESSQTALTVVDSLVGGWHRRFNMSNNSNELINDKPANYPDPAWPTHWDDNPWKEILRLAFGATYTVTSLDAPIVLRLLGKA
jgi:hypothetical protein